MNWREVNGKIGVQRLVVKEVVIVAVRQNPLTGKVHVLASPVGPGADQLQDIIDELFPLFEELSEVGAEATALWSTNLEALRNELLPQYEELLPVWEEATALWTIDNLQALMNELLPQYEEFLPVWAEATALWSPDDLEALIIRLRRKKAEQRAAAGTVVAARAGVPQVQKCRKCGQPKRRETGHTRYGNVHFCSAAAGKSVEDWLREMKDRDQGRAPD
ncbi:unnamed protein product [Leuciscus chuanchicus]